MEEQSAIGGFRDAACSVGKLPGWVAVGPILRRVLDAAISKRTVEMEAALFRIGRNQYDGPSLEFMDELNSGLCKAFNIPQRPRGSKGPHGQLLMAILQAAQDPDVVVGGWLLDKTPLGISQTIPANGIFPKLSPEDATRAARNYAPADEPGSLFGNYSSYTEFSDEADTELRRERQLGYMSSAATEGELQFGDQRLIPSRIAVIAKLRSDNTKKVRLVHDLSRSWG